MKRLLDQLGIASGYVVDIAAGDGINMSPTLPLYSRGWSGLAVEGDPGRFSELAQTYEIFPAVNLARTMVTPDTVAPLFRATGVPKAFDILNLDIDGYDLAVFDAIICGGFRPKVATIEINQYVPPPVFFTVRYSPDYHFHRDEFFGCSIVALEECARRHGYVLEGLAFNNAFLVSPDHADRVQPVTPQSAWTSGFRDQPDRERLFSDSAESVRLHSLPPEHMLAALKDKFRSRLHECDLRID